MLDVQATPLLIKPLPVFKSVLRAYNDAQRIVAEVLVIESSNRLLVEGVIETAHKSTRIIDMRDALMNFHPRAIVSIEMVHPA